MICLAHTVLATALTVGLVAQDATLDRDRLAAVRAGVASIRSQKSDGHFGTEHAVGNTALAIMALLASGEGTPGGAAADDVRKAVEWLASDKRRSSDGRLANGEQECYEHGLALMALAEAHGMLESTKLEQNVGTAIAGAIQAAAESQRDGGWRYRFDGRDRDLSATVMMLNGLRAAKGAGFAVPEGLIERAVNFVRHCRSQQGQGFGYTSGNDVRPGTNAAGIVCMQVAGGATSRELATELRVMTDYLRAGNLGQFPLYAAYYMAQACFQAGGGSWREVYPFLVRYLLDHRNAQGHWGTGNELYWTSMAVIALSAPERQLPVYIQSVDPADRRR